jgi:hypothetical protein
LFNQNIDKLPQSLTHLTIREGFKQSIDNLPQSLKYLTVNPEFDKSTAKDYYTVLEEVEFYW